MVRNRLEAVRKGEKNLKAIFFNDSEKQIGTVFNEAQRKWLRGHYGCERIYTSADLKTIPPVECLFSTWGMPVLTVEQVKEYFPALRAVFYAAGSVKYFADGFLKNGVRIFSGWQANAVPVAETAVSQILLANKGFFYLSSLCKKNYAAAREATACFPGNYDAKVGILGSGAIGMRVIRALRRHDLQIYVYSPEFTEELAAKEGVKSASLAEIFEECDVISNHMADVPATRGLIGRPLFSSMRPYSVFINTGRGAQVDEAALLERLERDRTVTAVLDVTYPEPPALASKLYALENVVLTPHSAGSSGFEVHRMAQYMIDESQRYFTGRQCLYEITEEMLKTMA